MGPGDIIEAMRIAVGELILAALFVLIFAGASWFLREGLAGAPQEYLFIALAFFFAATLFFICFGILSEKAAGIIPALLLASIASWLFLLQRTPVGGAAALVFFMLSTIAWVRMRQQRSVLLNPHFSSAAHAGLGMWILGLAVVLGVAAFVALPSQDILVKLIPEKIVQSSLPVVRPLLRQFLKVDLSATIDEFIQAQGKTKDFKAIAAAREAYGKQLGLEISDKTTFRDVIQQLIARQIKTLLSVVGKYLVFGFIIVFVVLSHTVAAPILWVLLVMGPLVMKLLKITGLIEEEQQTVVRTMLRWRSTKAS